MEILGYTDRLSVVPGERVQFMVSAAVPSYRADIVRLAHAYSTPKTLEFTEPVVATDINGDYRGRRQPLYAGSYAIVADSAAWRFDHGVTIQAWIHPTTPADGRQQGVLSKWSADEGGYGLIVNERGRLAFRIGTSSSTAEHVVFDQPLRAGQWYFVAGTYDAQSGEAAVVVQPLRPRWMHEPVQRLQRTIGAAHRAQTDAPFLIAGSHRETDERGTPFVTGLYNGKIDSPRLWGRALTATEIAALAEGASPNDLEGLVAAWDFSIDMASPTRLHDVSGNGLHALAVNMPTRGVTGVHWTGEDISFHAVPHQYGAVHFHEDDLEDANWESDFELTVPSDLPSGIYAARLRSGEAEEYVPFYVRPELGTSTADVAFLAPTNTYLAYANERLVAAEFDYTKFTDIDITPASEDQYLLHHREFAPSLYDTHQDGSGVCYSSRLRPILNMRPKYRTWINAGPRHFAADLHLIEWLETKGIRYDVLTDEDLHVSGKDLLAPYKVILTGSHPEYWTTPMLTGLETYLSDGGRLMYLGGNGFYWVTGMDAARPHVIEVRRGFAGTRCWESAPGETHLNLTGEPGGLWRHRGKAPNKLVGVGFTAQGWGGAAGYRRLPASYDERASFIFDGIAPDEVIGDFGLVMGGAAGDEIDRADPDLGTPPETLVLATSEGQHSDYYQLTIEDVPMMMPGMGGTEHRMVRADMTYTEMPNGGAVFSVGSINWCGSLPTNNFENNVSCVTENVLRHLSR